MGHPEATGGGRRSSSIPWRTTAGAKRVLGIEIPAGGGIEDGEKVLDLLAAHPSTARFVARKLAQKFVADQPPPALVDRLAAGIPAHAR